MKRKMILMALLCALLALGLSGCLFKPVNALYTLPQQPPEYDALQSELDRLLATGMQYSAPASAPQSIAANITAATAVVDMIYNILTVGETRVRQITFATGSVNMRATLQKTRRKAA